MRFIAPPTGYEAHGASSAPPRGWIEMRSEAYLALPHGRRDS